MATHAPITGAPSRATFLLPTADTPIGRILCQYDRPILENFIEVAVALLDTIGGDVDREDGDEDCCEGRDDDLKFKAADQLEDEDLELTYPEWHSRGRHKLGAGGGEMPGLLDQAKGRYSDDAENDDDDSGVEDGPGGFDPETDMCLAGDDGVFSGAAMGGGGVYVPRGAGDQEDEEREQMADDVPTLPVFAIQPNLFNGKRELLGYSNLLSSFRTNGSTVHSAETGKALRTIGTANGAGVSL